MKPPTSLRSPKISTWRNAASGSANGRRKQRKEAAAGLRHHLLGEPTVVGPAQLDLHFGLRMQADIEHAGRKQAGIIDAHRVHPAVAELHVAHLAFVGLLAAAQRIARHPPAHVLIAGRDRHDAGPLPRAAPHMTSCAQHVVLHERQELVVMLVLVMVRVDIDDQNVVEPALVRLLGGMREQPRGVELLDGNASAAIGDQLHDISAGCKPLVAAKAGTRNWIPACAGMSGLISSFPSPRPALPHAKFERGEIGGAQKAARGHHHVGGGDRIFGTGANPRRSHAARCRACTRRRSALAERRPRECRADHRRCRAGWRRRPFSFRGGALGILLRRFLRRVGRGRCAALAARLIASRAVRCAVDFGPGVLGEDINLVSLLHDVEFFQLHAPVGHAFAGLHIVFHAVPRADEVHLTLGEV